MDMAATWGFGVAGLLLGAGVSWALIARRASQREARLVAAAREQVAVSTQGIRAAHAKLQAELEKERAAAAASQSGPQVQLEQQRLLVQRLQAQLRAANAEIDRLQGASAPPPARPPAPAPRFLLPEDQIDPDGFAMTRPFER